MNWGIKTQEKIKKIIDNSLGRDAVKTIRNKGYNVFSVTGECKATYNGKYEYETFNLSLRKPKANKDCILILLSERNGVGFDSKDKKERFLRLSKTWVEIPKKIASSILVLNHFPDLI